MSESATCFSLSAPDAGVSRVDVTLPWSERAAAAEVLRRAALGGQRLWTVRRSADENRRVLSVWASGAEVGHVQAEAQDVVRSVEAGSVAVVNGDGDEGLFRDAAAARVRKVLGHEARGAWAQLRVVAEARGVTVVCGGGGGGARRRARTPNKEPLTFGFFDFGIPPAVAWVFFVLGAGRLSRRIWRLAIPTEQNQRRDCWANGSI